MIGGTRLDLWFKSEGVGGGQYGMGSDGFDGSSGVVYVYCLRWYRFSIQKSSIVHIL